MKKETFTYKLETSTVKNNKNHQHQPQESDPIRFN